MANEKPAAKPAEPAAAGEAPKKGGMPKMAMIAVAVVLIEGLVVGMTVKMFSGPRQVIAVPPAQATSEPAEKDVEVPLIDAKLPNELKGSLYLYDLQIVAKVGEKQKEKVTGLFEERKAEIRDQIRTIIASSDPKSLREPGLETLRRQISYQLEQDIGKDLIKEVLIPKCTAIKTEY